MRRAVLLLALARTRDAAYDDLGLGKCIVEGGRDPANSFHMGKGHLCEQLCDESADCHGYSASDANNCLLWEETGLLGGGASWGEARCYVQQSGHQAASKTCDCKAHGGCHWEPAANCVKDFWYEGDHYTNCTTVEFEGRGWCSLNTDYKSQEYSMCTMACPPGCWWKQPTECVPHPAPEPCWRAPRECVPEFWYKGKLFQACTMEDTHEGAWCSHNFRYATASAWSPCTPCCEGGSRRGATLVAVVSGALGFLCAGVPVLLILYNKDQHSARSVSTWALHQGDPIE